MFPYFAMFTWTWLDPFLPRLGGILAFANQAGWGWSLVKRTICCTMPRSVTPTKDQSRTYCGSTSNCWYQCFRMLSSVQLHVPRSSKFWSIDIYTWPQIWNLKSALKLRSFVSGSGLVSWTVWNCFLTVSDMSIGSTFHNPIIPAQLHRKDP